MIARVCERVLRAKLRTFPVILVIGPRQCGKTTLVRKVLPGWKYLDLERTSDLQSLSLDPEKYLESHPSRLIFDECHRLPSLFPLMRGAVDADRRPGRFVLTGSINPFLVKEVTESLTGRVGIVSMTPLLAGELADKPAWLSERWFWGGFPPVFDVSRAGDKADWLDAYLIALSERDLPRLRPRIPPTRALKLLQMLAHVHGGILNASEVAGSLGVSHTIMSRYLDALEGTFVIRRLQPFFENVGKRLVKSPKLYVRDTGLLHRLSGLAGPADLESWPRRGASWEGFVIEELATRAAVEVPGAAAYFWRTRAGGETDLILAAGLRKAAVEIKSASSCDVHGLRGLRECMKDLGLKSGYLVYRGRDRMALTGGIRLMPWREILRPGFTRGLLRG
ncbi:MAG: ATP-binding protein [Elusimicrobia bacterium]|nr:ATP-binding protein [Elusimicrobiota bacterium]